MTWNRGRDAVQRMVDDRELQRVPAHADLAGRLLDEAAQHLASADAIVEIDPPGAYQLVYDGARKSCAALLAIQGLRATTKGGHVAVQDTVREQFGPPGGHLAFGEYARLRRTRASAEYPRRDTPTITTDDVTDALQIAREIYDAASKLIDTGRLDTF